MQLEIIIIIMKKFKQVIHRLFCDLNAFYIDFFKNLMIGWFNYISQNIIIVQFFKERRQQERLNERDMSYYIYNNLIFIILK